MKKNNITKWVSIALISFSMLGSVAQAKSMSNPSKVLVSWKLNQTINGKLVEQKENGYTLFSLQNVLRLLHSIGANTQWNGKELVLTIDQKFYWNNPHFEKGKKTLIVNGKRVAFFDTSVQSIQGIQTTYVSSQWVHVLLKSLGVKMEKVKGNWKLEKNKISKKPSILLNPVVATFNQDLIHTTGFVRERTLYLPISVLQQGLKDFHISAQWKEQNNSVTLSVYSPSQSKHTEMFPMFHFLQTDYMPTWAFDQWVRQEGIVAKQKNFEYTLNMIPKHPLQIKTTGIYSYTRMEKELVQLQATYPTLIHIENLGKTIYGRNLQAVSLGTGKIPVFIAASHHAREWITSVLAMYMINQYAYDDKTNKILDGYHVRTLLQKTTLWFMPMVNPDGVTLEQYGLSKFPKSAWKNLVAMNHGSTNFITWKANAQGIDPNEQYNGGWYQIHNGVNQPGPEHYKGTKPYQINEIKAVMKLIHQVHPLEEITYHASGQVIYWHYSWRPQYPEFEKLAAQLSQATTYPLRTASGNQAGGGLTDWWTYNVEKPGFTIEVGPSFGDMPVPIKYFPLIWKQNATDGLILATQAIDLTKKSHA